MAEVTSDTRTPAQILAAHVLRIAESTDRDDRLQAMDDLLENGYPLGFILVAFRATVDERHRLENRPLLVERSPEEGERLRSMPYEHYLKSDHWLKVKRAALAFYGRSCQLCASSRDELHVHHRTYDRRGSERISDVQVLCADCHAKHHDIQMVA